jgi:hypothetical protein
MKLQIVSIHNHGKAAEEYVRLQVIEDCKLGDYVIIDSTYNADGRLSNKMRHTYWWGPKEFAKKGDIVFLYTREGKNTTRPGLNCTLRDYYWNSKEAVWNDTGDFATLFQIANFSQKATSR